jgi:hypothetical protein
MGKMTISTATIKAYVDKQRTMNNKRYSKQTQSNPISNAQTPYPAYQPRDCHGPGGLAMTIGRGDGRKQNVGRLFTMGFGVVILLISAGVYCAVRCGGRSENLHSEGSNLWRKM